MLRKDQRILSSQDESPFDHVPQLANVARPGMSGQDRLGSRRDVLVWHPAFAAESGQEVNAEGQNVFNPVLQRLNLDRKYGEPVIEIFPECFLLYPLSQVDVGGG